MIQSKNYDGVLCTLVNEKTGKALVKGDNVKLSPDRGEPDGWFLTGGRAPQSPASTGRVYVQNRRTAAQADYYPSVVGAMWVSDFTDTRFMPLS